MPAPKVAPAASPWTPGLPLSRELAPVLASAQPSEKVLEPEQQPFRIPDPRLALEMPWTRSLACPFPCGHVSQHCNPKHRFSWVPGKLKLLRTHHLLLAFQQPRRPLPAPQRTPRECSTLGVLQGKEKGTQSLQSLEKFPKGSGCGTGGADLENGEITC